jgi:hypothetical protein
VFAEGLDVSSPLLLVGGGFHQTIRLFEKKLWLDGHLGVGSREYGITLAEGLQDCGRRVVPLLNYTITFAL